MFWIGVLVGIGVTAVICILVFFWSLGRAYERGRRDEKEVADGE